MTVRDVIGYFKLQQLEYLETGKQYPTPCRCMESLSEDVLNRPVDRIHLNYETRMIQIKVR